MSSMCSKPESVVAHVRPAQAASGEERAREGETAHGGSLDQHLPETFVRDVDHFPIGW